MKITIETIINAPLELVWECWVGLGHISKWAFASDDWQAEAKENNLVVGGVFKTYMSAKDGSAGFDFAGTYTVVEEKKKLAYALGDERAVEVLFEETPDGVRVTEIFDPENENPIEMQRAGWQSILDNFKKYTESLEHESTNV